MSSGFAKVSRDELFGGCVGAVDGFFQAITCPPVSEVSNQTSYYSGHYENFGLNCQAVCTHDLTFIYFGVVAPGSTNDIIAITKTGNLMDEIRKLARVGSLLEMLLTNSQNICLHHSQVHNNWIKGKMPSISTCHRSELELRWHLDD